MYEQSRLGVLKSYSILDTPPATDFDQLTRMAAFICQTPMAAISFIDETRQWFKSVHGFSLQETAGSDPFCDQLIKTRNSLIVHDARDDARFAESSLVTAAPRIGFYAGIPLISPEGHLLGIVSVMDSVARELSNEQQAHLKTLALQIIEKLELRRQQMSRGSANSEASVQRMAARLGTILESITDAFIAIDRNWQFTYINSEAERLLQRSREDLTGKNLWLEFPTAVGSAFEHYYKMAMTEGGKVSFEEFYAPLNTWFSVNVYPSSEGLAIYFQNIDARRGTQEQLILLQTCVAHMNDLVVITEAEPQSEPGPRILFVNEAFVERTGYSREEVIGKSPRFLQGPKTQRPALQRIRESIKKWQPIREELINYTKAGEEFWLDIDLVPVADSSGRFTHWIAVERDISERKQAEVESARIVELEQAQKLADLASQAKSQFLATMSHEIRTPISGVIGMAEALQQSGLEDYQIDMVDIIRDSAQSLLGIVEDILDFSKIEAGKVELESIPINVFDLVKSVCSILDRFAENKQVELTFFCDPALPETVLGDELRLRQVLLNLVNNAIKFSSESGRSGKVNLRARLLAVDKETVSVNFLVIDNGIGMADATVARLFNPFVQADVSTTRHFGGTGLGLTISRHLVELMGGEIKVESQPDLGSTFEVTLSFKYLPSHLLEKPELPEIKGLRCVVLGEEQRLGNDIVTYIKAAGLEVLRILEPQQIMRLAQPRIDDTRIWIFDAFNIDSWLAAIPAEFSRELRRVVINRDLRRRLCFVEKNCVSVGGNLLDRYALFKAIAIAAEREQADKLSGESGVSEAAFLPPVRELVSGQQRLILVAEDNETNQKVIARQLALLGYVADIVSNGREAMEYLQTQKYSLLLTDLHMPEVDGYELVASIRAQEDGSNYLPIIALSANALSGEGERCRNLGMDDYLTKPASLAELQNCIERWLRRESNTVPAINVVQSNDDAPLKLSVLTGLVGDDAEVVEDFLIVFQQDALTLASSFREFSVSGDLMKLAAVAHKLKSSARSVGALRLGDISADIEAAAKAGEAARVAERLTDFERELTLVNDYINNR